MTNPPTKREADTRLLEVVLEEKLGSAQPPDVRHRVLAASAKQSASARQLVRRANGRTAGSLWMAAAVVMLGVTVTFCVVYFSQGRSGSAEEQGTGGATAPEEGNEQDRQSGEKEFRPKTFAEFLRHVSKLDAVSVEVITIKKHSHTLAPDQRGAVRFRDPATVKQLSTLLARDLRPTRPAGWKWPNRIRLHATDGRYVECSMYRAGAARLGLRALGDYSMRDDLAKQFGALVSKAEEVSRIREGIVFTHNDLRRDDPDAVPSHVEKLTCYSLFDKDLELLGRFHKLSLLDLRGCSKTLDGSGMKHVAKLKTIEHILLNNTSIGDAGLAELGRLPALRQLNLRYAARLTGTGFRAFQATNALDRLNLTLCPSLSDRGIVEVAKIQSLRHLDLSGRRLGVVTPEGLASLSMAKGLESLDLSDCPLDLVDAMGGLGALRKLWFLDLADTKVGADGFAAFHFIHEKDVPAAKHPLRVLDLSRCDRLDAKALAIVAGYGRLEDLNLTRCRGLAPGDLHELSRAHGLRSLRLSGTEISAADCKAVATLPMLESLDVSFTKIGDEALAHLGSNRSIRELSLVGCDAITDAGLGFLGQLKTLERLDMSNCDGITKRGVRSLRKALPESAFKVPDRLK